MADPWDADLAKVDREWLPFWPSDVWQDTKPEPIEFLIKDWLAIGSGALLAGEGGTGKSLLGQMLCSCVALGKPFLGQPVKKVTAAYVTCEDDEHILQIRQHAINEMLGVKMADYGDFLTLWSLKGKINNELGTFDGEGRLTPTPLFEEIAEMRCKLTCLDNASHFFAGNENARHDVAAFCNMLDRLAMQTKGVAILLAHTPKTGAEFSGSTGWDAHVRQRLFLSHAHDTDPDARVLKRSKANYARRGETIEFRWHNGAFCRHEDIPPHLMEQIAVTARVTAENAAFLSCLSVATERKRAVSHNPGSNYAPKIFSNMPESKSFSAKALASAMERLLSLGQIALDQPLWRGPNRVMKQGIKATEICTDPPAQTPCTDPHETPGNTARFNPPNTTYRNGAALEAAAPSPEGSGKAVRTTGMSFEHPDPAEWG